MSATRNTKPPHPAALLNEAIQRIVANPTTLDAELANVAGCLEQVTADLALLEKGGELAAGLNCSL